MSRRVTVVLSLLALLVAVWLFRRGGGEGERPDEARDAGTERVAKAQRPRDLPPSRDLDMRSSGGESAPPRLGHLHERRKPDAAEPMRTHPEVAPEARVPGLTDDLGEMIHTATTDPDPTKRAAAIADISLIDDTNVVVPLLRQVSSDPDPDVKLAIVNALSDLGEDAPMDLLTRFANDSDPDIRLEVLDIVEALSEEESTAPRVQPLLQSAARDSNADVRDKAQDIIESLSDDEEEPQQEQ